MSEFRRAQVLAALSAARASLREISPQLCVAFLDAWQEDRRAWAGWIETLPTGRTAAEALRILGLSDPDAGSG
jgi:hypothetical protein